MSTNKRRLILYNDDTIVAIATASGIGSISIVRVSGAKALEIALKISQKTTINPRIATLSYLYDKNKILLMKQLSYILNLQTFYRRRYS